MTDCTVAAPVRATKAPASAKKAPAPAPTKQPMHEGELDNPEVTVAVAAVELIQLAQDHHSANMGPDGLGSVYGSELTYQAIEQLQGLIAGEPEYPGSTVFHAVAAIVCGALAYDRIARPAATERHSWLEQAFTILDSAAISHDFVQEPCEALAIGIRAGARPHRDRPSPPIRRVDDASQSQAGYRHSPRDIRAVFETLATQCEAVRDFSADIRSRLQGDSGSVVEACNDLTIMQHMVAFMGSMCDEMTGTGKFIGGPASWATMDRIEPLGGAA